MVAVTAGPRFDAELRALAGADAGAERFTVRWKGCAVGVTVVTDGDGDATDVALSAAYDLHARPAEPDGYRGGRTLVAPRPLAIELRRELATDADAKERGLSVEWQSGDDAFDRAVYVSTPTADGAVLAAVLGAEVRAAALELLGLGFERVGLDVAGEVRASLPRRAFVEPEPLLCERALDAFVRVLEGVPRVTASGERHPDAPLAGVTRALGVVGAAGWLTNVGFAGLVVYAVRRAVPGVGTDATTPLLVALGAGLFAGFAGASLYGAAVARRAWGRSDAHTLVGRAKVAAFGGFSVVTFAAAFAAALVAFR